MDLSLILASCFISLVGLPHGALDPVVAHRCGLIHDLRSSAQFFVGYIIVVALVVLLWLQLPAASLLLFLLISCVHFGRDWKQKISFGGFAYGAFVLGLPAWTAPEQVEQIFSFLIFQDIADIQLIFLQGLGVIGISLLVFDRGRISRLSAGELLILIICATSFEPLWYFVAYFCGLHSPRHLIAEFRSMRKETRFSAYVVMLAVTILTLGIAAVSGSHLEKYYASIDIAIYQTIFIGLAALTVPHMCLLEWAGKKYG